MTSESQRTTGVGGSNPVEVSQRQSDRIENVTRSGQEGTEINRSSRSVTSVKTEDPPDESTRIQTENSTVTLRGDGAERDKDNDGTEVSGVTTLRPKE